VTKDYEVTDKRRSISEDNYYDKAPASLVTEERHLTDEEIIKKYSFAKRMLNSHLLIHIDSFGYKGRIIIPDKQKHRPTKGLVVNVASDITDIHVGDRIVMSQFAGYLIKFENVPAARVISYSEVLFVVDQNSPDIESEGA
jgi:co-chaperonin GroES (HSP10)